MAEYIKQNTKGLKEIIQKSGCFFRAATHIAELETKKKLTKTQINELYRYCRKCCIIDVDDDVVNSAEVATLALRFLGNATKRITEVATFQNGVMGWYQSIPKAERKADYYIQKGMQNGPQKYHFYNVDKYGKVTWEPHEPAIKITKVLYTICYRVDKE